MHIRNVLFPIMFVLLACSTSLDKQHLQIDTKPHIAPSLILQHWKTTPFVLTQLVEGKFQDTTYQANFEIEWKDQTLTIVGLSLVGLPFFKAQVSATRTDLQLLIPDSEAHALMDPAWIVSDFLLTRAPAELLEDALLDSNLHIVSDTSLDRSLQRGDKTMVQIIYSEPSLFSSEVILNNLELGYSIYIKNLRLEEINP